MWKDWLALSKREQKGFIVLSIILAGLLIFNLLIPFMVTSGNDPVSGDKELQTWIDSTIAINKRFTERSERSLFSFDPNKASIATLQKLGFSDKAIVNLLKFRENGGRFHKPDDILNIYNLDSTLALDLLPYVKIQSEQKNTLKDQSSYNKAEPNSSASHSQNNIKKEENIFVIEINSADTADLAILKGIGSTLSKRIIAFRKVLGGFYSVEQLKEVYGMPASVIEDNAKHLTVNRSLIKKMDVNSASLRKLKSHPYISFYLAKAIVEYREKNNGIKDLNEIFSLIETPPELKSKLNEYLYVNNK